VARPEGFEPPAA